jgi:cold shock CspA family protein/uncharacterized glyoxalase superfamily protein PhnB
MPQGTITRLNHTRGFGFLNTPEGEDLFFHRTNMKDTPFSRLQVGDRVTYDVTVTSRGPRAGNVQLHAPAVQLQVNLAVQDLQRSAQFYARILNFKTVIETPGHILLNRGSLVLGLKTDELFWPQPTGEGEEGVKRGAGVELVLEMSDIQDFYEQIQRLGIPIHEPLREQPWEARDFRILDPDGYYWRITSPRVMTDGLAESDEAMYHPEDDSEHTG